MIKGINELIKMFDVGCEVDYNDSKYRYIIDELIYELIKTKKVNLIINYPFEDLGKNIIESGNIEYMYYFVKNVEGYDIEKMIQILESYNKEKTMLKK